MAEMREPPLGLEAVPDPALEIYFDEILAAPTTEELLVGIYEAALPRLAKALIRHTADTNLIADAPSVRLARHAWLDMTDMLEFGRQAIACLVDDATRHKMQPWTGLLDDALAAAGGLDGAEEPSGRPVERMYSKTPYVYDPIPRRDERFQDLHNQGVNPEAFLYSPGVFAPRAKTLMMLFKRLREIDVPEMMASIIVETKGKPWGYYRDMSRQLWDEARHAMMGEVGFVAHGVDWTQARITHNWSYRLNTECTPIERHAVLYFIEQGLMNKTGKKYEWEVGVASGDPLMATIQDYDWADEVLHAALGREWYIPEIGNWKDAVEYGDRCWSKILSNWSGGPRQGPDPARELVALDLSTGLRPTGGVEPDPAAMAFSESYEARASADLKAVSGKRGRSGGIDGLRRGRIRRPGQGPASGARPSRWSVLPSRPPGKYF